MVTRRFIRMMPEEKAAAAKAAAGSRQKAGSSGDDTKNDTTEGSKDTQLRQSSKNRRMNHDIDDGGKPEAVTCPKNYNTPNKRSLPLEDSGDNDKKRPRKRGQKFIDLSDVSDQLPILSNRKSGSSKYQGVTFNKAKKKWQAKIIIDGKQRTIGSYDNEEEAAKDYARAVYKYRGGTAAIEREQQKRQKFIDLSDVTEQLPILNSNGKSGSSKYQGVAFDKAHKKKHKFINLSDVPEQLPILKSTGKSASSKYQGVIFNKAKKKWQAKIIIDGKQRTIGSYDNEEEAAKDYARAVYKYRGGTAAIEREQQKRQKAFDLSDVPEQLPILKSNGKSGSSKYQGVAFDKVHQKWQTQISIDGKLRAIGNYDDEEEAAKDYARAVFKYRGGKSAVERQRQKKPKVIDLCDVPEQQPILKSNGKNGSSKYQGVTFDKAAKKWRAIIAVEGKLHHIGYYINEEEAAKDYARAVHKYLGLKSAVER